MPCMGRYVFREVPGFIKKHTQSLNKAPAVFLVMAGLVPAIRRGIVPLLTAGTSPAITKRGDSSAYVSARVSDPVAVCRIPTIGCSRRPAPLVTHSAACRSM
jgi:hypothetical protein